VILVEHINIVGFAGSLRRSSYNRGLVRAAAESAPPGITIEVLDLADIPLYNQDVEDAGEPLSVAKFKGAISGASALLVATPEYNHGIPGVLKNAIDWACPRFHGTGVGSCLLPAIPKGGLTSAI